MGDSTPDPTHDDAGGRGRTLRTLVTLLVGVGLIAWLLRHAGFAEVETNLLALGHRAPLVLIPYAIIALFDSYGWACTFSAESRRRVSLWRLYLVRMAGEAVNSVTPTAAVGGEPVKALLLRQAGVPAAEAVASLVITKTALTVTQALFVVVGLAGLFEFKELHWIGMLLLAVLFVLCLGFGFGLVHLQRRGPVTTLWRWLHRIMPRARFVERLAGAAASIDQRLVSFYEAQHGSFFRASAWHMCGWFTGVGEIFLLMYLIGHPITWQQALIIESLAQVIRASAIVVPGALGTQELGGVAVCTLLGIPEAPAATLWLLKRGRELIFDGVGLLFLLPQGVRASQA